MQRAVADLEGAPYYSRIYHWRETCIYLPEMYLLPLRTLHTHKKFLVFKRNKTEVLRGSSSVRYTTRHRKCFFFSMIVNFLKNVKS